LDGRPGQGVDLLYNGLLLAESASQDPNRLPKCHGVTCIHKFLV
jgi:hypothetical protein